MFKSYEEYDAVGLAELIARKEVSASEVLEAAISKTAAINSEINAVTTELYQVAREYASQPTAGFFSGVPFLIKDLGICLAGEITTQGSRYFQYSRADYDSTLVSRYKQCGLNIFGKTNTAELGLDVTTESSLLGACRNPINTAYSSGGSSGGAAAAVAAGIVPAAHASDGGGSIRIPASCCGVFGFKPSRGVIPCGPDAGEGWAGLSTSHVITRTVRDSAAIFDFTQGYEMGAPYAPPKFSQSAYESLSQRLPPLKIAIMPDAPIPFDTHPTCIDAVEHAAKLCEHYGHYVEYAQPAINIEELMDAIYVIICANTKNLLSTCAQSSGKMVTEALLEKATWEMLQYAARYSAEDYARAVVVIHSHGRKMARFFQKYNVLLTPTLAAEPAKIGELNNKINSYDDIKAFHFDVDTRYTPFTIMFNASGQPAMSVPLYNSACGLPIGVQFAAAFGEDLRLFQLANQLINN